MSDGTAGELRRQSRFLRLLGEGVAIFVGVLLALIAEDWRETRNDREEARESLRVVLADLRQDSVEYAVSKRHWRRHSAAASWLVRNWDRADNDIDSLQTTLYQFSTGTSLELSRGGYEGLQRANGLRHIEDDSLRNGMLRYYEVSQREKATFYDESGERLLDLNDALSPYIRNLEGRDIDRMWPPRGRHVVLRRPWTEIATDHRLHGEVVWLGRFMSLLADFLEQGEEEAGRLMMLIRSQTEE